MYSYLSAAKSAIGVSFTEIDFNVASVLGALMLNVIVYVLTVPFLAVTVIFATLPSTSLTTLAPASFAAASTSGIVLP